MTGKDEAVKKLRERGFDAFNCENVVTVRLDTTDNGFRNKFEQVLRDIGYNESFGIKGNKIPSAINMPSPDSYIDSNGQLMINLL